jgi:outer membrane protein, multidrug efflux system
MIRDLIPYVMLLSACSLIPDYLRPDMPVAKEWATTPWPTANTAEQSGKPTWGDIAWKEYLTDATLQYLIQKALDNNRDLRVRGRFIALLQCFPRWGSFRS